MILLEKQFPVDSRARLDLDLLPGRTVLRKAESETVKVIISGPEDFREQVSAELKNGTVVVRGPRESISGSSVVSISGGFSGSICISGGKVLVNGVDVTAKAGSGSKADAGQLQFEIWMPGNTPLSIGRCRDLLCEVAAGDVQCDIRGQSTIRLDTIGDLTGAVSGQADIEVARVTGDELDLALSGQFSVAVREVSCSLRLNASGQGSGEFHGTFPSVSITVSGMAKTITSGTVRGNYTARASGMSRITHKGEVLGHISQSSSGMSDISVG